MSEKHCLTCGKPMHDDALAADADALDCGGDCRGCVRAAERLDDDLRLDNEIEEAEFAFDQEVMWEEGADE